MDFSVPDALRKYGKSRPEQEEQEAVPSKNVTQACHDRLAFSVNSQPAVGACSVPAETLLHYDPEPDACYSADHPKLARARDALQALVTQRIRELQFLTGWPLVRPRRTHADVSRLMAAAGQEGSGGEHWAALGMPSSPFNELPDLPELVRKDLYTSLDLLMALAGHLSLGQSPNTPQGMSSLPSSAAKLQPNSNPQQPLPRSLAQISMLPALQSLRPPTLPWLRDFFADLQPQQPQVGLDDRLYSWFRDGKVQIARSLVAEGDIGHCRSFARFGCPHGCRAGVWEAALGLSQGSSKKAAQEEFNGLIHEACAQQLLADVWLCTEMASVHDSEHFFLFEDILKSVTLAFLRDHRISHHCSVQPHPVLSAPLDANAAASPSCTAGAVAAATCRAARAQSKQSSTDEPSKDKGARDATTCPYPPCGVLPPQGSILMAAPLCFVYGEPAAVYCMHRALYCRYWCKLHTLSSVGLPSPALPMLLRTYEDLLQELDPKVVAHLHRLGIPAAAVALPWISKAFVGFMPVEEVLLLWDRVIGLDSLLPVALLAVAVVCFRRQVILSCQAGREVLDAMADLSQLQTVPLLQAALFSG